MLKKYPEKISNPVEKEKSGPSGNTLNALLNYSKSLQTAQIRKEKILIQLN